MIGALLALELVPALTRPILREIVAGVGLALILVAIFTFSDGTRFPGPAALLPCVGAGAIIHAGRSGSTLVGRLLSTKFFVGFGLISYSLYLWHWPLIVFAKAWLIRNPTTSEAILIFCASVGAATFSWAFIERPFRGRDRVFRRNSLFLASGIAMCCLALFGAFGKMSHGWPGRLPDRVVELAAFKHSQDPRRMKCLADAAHSIAVKDACVYGADVPPTYAVWGDSHSGAIMQALGEVAASKQKAIKFIGYGGCVPVIGLDVKLARSCLPHNQEALEFLKNEASIKTVILIGRYVAYLYGTDVDSDPDGERIPLIRKADGSLPTVSEAEQLFDEQFRQTVTALLDAGKNVVLVYPIPDAGFDVPSTLATLELRAKDPAPFILDRDAYLRSQRKILEVLDGVKPDNRVSRIYPADLLCAEKKCIVTADGTPLYRDHTHLNMIGSRYVARLFETTFSQ
jgi:hypothetical protein